MEHQKRDATATGIIALFGSGELASTGRKIHERLISSFPTPVHIALLLTPAGHEANPYHWYTKLANVMRTGLQNYKPEITLVPALTREGEKSTNDPVTLAGLMTAAYIHTGAGSPTYAVRHLKQTRAVEMIHERLTAGSAFSLASAGAMAFGQYVLPVYEIYRAGEDLHWKEGLDFFAAWGMKITIIPHWNNTEGGEGIDTRYVYMGEKRFHQLLTLLPSPTTILGIDEHTAVLLDVNKKMGEVMGAGMVTIFPSHKKETARTFHAGDSFPLSLLQGD